METILNQGIHFFLRAFYPFFRKVLPFQLYTYLACGAINTVLNIGLFALFYQLILPQPGFIIAGHLLQSYVVSLVVAFLLTVPTGFWLNRQFAFRQSNPDSNPAHRQGIKYFLVVLQGLLSDYLIMLLFIVVLHLHPTWAKVISTIIVLTLNYLLQKHFTFKVKKHG
jgi:putative flippase GtrA